MDQVIRDTIAGMASGRSMGIVRFPPGLALAWESWAIYPDRDASFKTIGDADAFYAQAERQVSIVVGRLVGVVDESAYTIERCHRGRLPYISVHGAAEDVVLDHRRLQP